MLLVWKRRRKRNQAQRLSVLTNHVENYDEEQKAELAGSQVEEQRQHGVDVKPELDGHTFSAAVLNWNNRTESPL